MLVYEKEMTREAGLVGLEKKWNVVLSPVDAVLGAKIVGVSFKKEREYDGYEDCEVTIELDNGSEIEIYLNCDGTVNVVSD